MDRLIIIGASGHGKVVADVAKLLNYTDIVFLDNDSSIKECAGYPVIGKDNMTVHLDGEIFIAVGNAAVRKKLMERDKDRVFPTLIHPSAVIADSVNIGAGSVIMAGVVINPGVSIGRGVIVNTSSSIDHDCIVNDFCHISVGSHLCGTVNIGEETWIGAGATVSNNLTICGGCIIGAGAVVIKSIHNPGVYVGVPAKITKKTEGKAFCD